MTTTKTVAEKAKARRLNTTRAAAAAPAANAEWNFPTAKQMEQAKAVPAAAKPAEPKAPEAAKPAAPAPAKPAEVKADPAPVVGKRTRKPVEAKPAADKGQSKAKPTVQAVEFVVRKAKPGQTITVLADVKVGGARPTKGAALYAHTHAALTILGLFDKGEVKMGTLLSVIGRTAVTHHLDKANLKQGKSVDMVKLSEDGLSHFKGRTIDNELANAYVTLFLDGKIGKALGSLRSGQTFQIAV